jgi:two-component system phosphate regulon sensor histidine kinase PhoR
MTLSIIITALAVIFVSAALFLWLQKRKLILGIRNICSQFQQQILPNSRSCDSSIIKNLCDEINKTFKENTAKISSLVRQTKELDIQIKLLARQKDNIESIIYSIHDAVIVADSFDRLTLANKEAGKIFNFDPKSSKLKPLEEIISEDNLRFIELLRQSRQSGLLCVKRELQLGIENQETKTYECLISCLFTSDSQINGVVAVLHDITREKEISQMKNEFVSNVSHELKTPLASINAYAEMLADGEAEDEETKKEFCSVIQSQAQRLNRLIEDILNISRIESGLIKVKKEPISLAVLIRDAVEMIKSYAAEKNITVSEKSQIIFDQVLADKDMMSQVVVNLLSNAVKYTPQGGSVTIDTEVDESTEVVRVFVKDTGVGIPENEIDKLFNKFYRVSSNNKYAKGTGLGLNLVKQIVENIHSGQVFVKSKVGEGSTFGFSVPLYQNSEQLTTK